MKIFTIFLLAACLGIVVCGILVAFVFRSEPRRAMNILLVTFGVAALVYGHVQWIVSREAPVNKMPLCMIYIVPGWALLTMGWIGLQCGGHGNDKDDS